MPRPAPITEDRTGWDFFHSPGTLGEHIEKEDQVAQTPTGLGRHFASDDEGALHVLYRTLALLEQLVTDALEVDEAGLDADGHRLDSLLFARRVLAAVGRAYPDLARTAAASDAEANAFLRRLTGKPGWTEATS
jgi:hypothetical protein